MSEANWYYTALTLLAVSTLFYALHALQPKKLFQEGGWGAMLLSCLCLMVSLTIRSQTAQYFALSNMYESLMVVCIGIQMAFLALDRWFGLRMLGLPVTVLLLGSLIWDLTLPTEIHPLQPALQSYWRSIHVPIILLSYALFTIAFLGSLVYLLKDLLGSKSESGSQGGSAKLKPLMAGAQSGALAMEDASMLDIELALAQDKANLYDEITYRCVAFGFPLLTLGIILGGMWANEAWGNYWSWDPKESMSLVTLLGYGVYLHMRINGEHSPRTLAWVSVVGFILMLVTYFGVNLMGVGLHSYGKIG
ncbi:MAG TPA: c-type cytochrome biogenesis protein CcsB [Coleofasciculaceae cyanobacterium]|jgi:cytochrome c-type biogenesis protein CcsB